MSESMVPPSAHPAAAAVEEPLTTTAAFVVPQVNLLPASFAQAARIRRARFTAAATVVTALLLVLLGWLIGLQQRSGAQEQLDIALSEHAVLQVKASEFADVPKVFAEVADAQLQLRTAMGNEVRWSFFLNDVALRMPSGVSLDSLTATAALPGESATNAADPAAATGEAYGGGTVGSLNVSAKALSYNHVANWLDALAKLPTLASPEALSLNAVDEEGRTLIGFESAAVVTTDALSNRYTQEGGQTP
jgi:Tfp pilus assembly protein PilN